MAITINLNKAKRVILENGWYLVDIDRAEEKPAKQGNMDATIHLEMVTADNGEGLDGVRLYRDQSLTEKSWWSVLEMLEAAFGEIQGDEQADFVFEASDLVGQRVAVYVSMDNSYDGRERNKVDTFASADRIEELLGEAEASADGEDGADGEESSTDEASSEEASEEPASNDAEPEASRETPRRPAATAARRP